MQTKFLKTFKIIYKSLINQLQVNLTIGNKPERGSEMEDIFLPGLNFLDRIVDRKLFPLFNISGRYSETPLLTMIS